MPSLRVQLFEELRCRSGQIARPLVSRVQAECANVNGHRSQALFIASELFFGVQFVGCPARDQHGWQLRQCGRRDLGRNIATDRNDTCNTR